MLTKADIEDTRWFMYRIKHDRNSHVAFVQGYLSGKNNKKLVDHISLYLNQRYQINTELTTFMEQIDHYAAMHNWDLLSGFGNLLREVYYYKGVLKQKKISEVDYQFKTRKAPTTRKSIEEGGGLQVGDFIQLDDKIGEDYTLTKFYDATILDPSWDLFYPSEKDFKHLQSHFGDVNVFDTIDYGQVRRIFSNSILKINTMFIEDGILVAYTDICRIEVKKALEQKEFEVVNASEVSIHSSYLVDAINNDIGLISGSVEKTITYQCFFCFGGLNKEWHRYDRNINGKWYEYNKS